MSITTKYVDRELYYTENNMQELLELMPPYLFIRLTLEFDAKPQPND